MIDPSAAWLAVDCDICGAPAFEPCRAQLCSPDCSSCKGRDLQYRRGECFHAGGNRERNRERAESGL